MAGLIVLHVVPAAVDEPCRRRTSGSGPGSGRSPPTRAPGRTPSREPCRIGLRVSPPYVVGAGIVPSSWARRCMIRSFSRPEAPNRKQEGVQPFRPGDLIDGDQVPDRVLGGPDPAGRLDRPPLAGLLVPVPDRLQHHMGHRQGRRRRDLAGRGLDEVAAGQQRQPGRPAHVVVGRELAGLQDHLQPGVPQAAFTADDLIEHLAVAAGQERAAVDHHVDLVGARVDRHPRFGQLDLETGPAGWEGSGHRGHLHPGVAEFILRPTATMSG